MSTYAVLMLVPMFGLLVWAAVQDFATRRIPNWLSFSLILSGLIQSFFPAGTVSPGDAFLGFGVGFGLTFALFVLGAVGGGDVKLLAGVGAWLGPWPVFGVFVVEKVVGLVIVLVQATAQGRLRTLFRNSGVIAVNLAHLGDVGLDHVAETGRASASVNRPLPYAVPVLAGVFVIVGLLWK